MRLGQMKRAAKHGTVQFFGEERLSLCVIEAEVLDLLLISNSLLDSLF